MYMYSIMPRYPKRERQPLPNELKRWVGFLKDESEKTGRPYAGLTTKKSVSDKYRKQISKTPKVGNTEMREQTELRKQKLTALKKGKLKLKIAD